MCGTIKALTAPARGSPNYPSVESGKWLDSNSNRRYDVGEYLHYNIIIANESTVALSALQVAERSGSVNSTTPDSGLLGQSEDYECNAFRQVQRNKNPESVSCQYVRSVYRWGPTVGTIFVILGGLLASRTRSRRASSRECVPYPGHQLTT